MTAVLRGLTIVITLRLPPQIAYSTESPDNKTLRKIGQLREEAVGLVIIQELKQLFVFDHSFE